MKIILVLVATAMAGCATVGGNKQLVLIKTNPSHIEIRQNGELIGVTPAIVKLPRQHHLDLDLVDGSGAKTPVHMTGQYRWGRSIGGNLLFFTLAPIGWIVDAVSGAAWHFDKEADINLGANAQSVTTRKDELSNTIVAIAPPTSNHANISDEVARTIEKKLADDQHDFQVMPYDKTLETFRDEDLDYDRSKTSDDLTDAYALLKTRHIYFSNIEEKENKIHVMGQINDVFDSKNKKQIDFEIPKENIKAVGDIGITRSYSDLLYWLPNAFGIDLGQTSTNFSANDETYKGSPIHSSDFISVASEFVSAISVRRIFQPIDRDGWHFRLGFSPTFSFSYAKEEFKDIQVLSGTEFDRTHLDAGWGPNFNYGNRHWNFYLNLIPIAAYDQIETTISNQKYSVHGFSGTLAAESGVMYFITPHWVTRAFARSANVPKSLWEKVVSDALAQPVSVDSAKIVTTGLGINYIFPGSTLKFW